MIDGVGLRFGEYEMLTHDIKIKLIQQILAVGKAPCLSEVLSLL